jgi:hypothetical protein
MWMRRLFHLTVGLLSLSSRSYFDLKIALMPGEGSEPSISACPRFEARRAPWEREASKAYRTESQ